MTVIGIYNTQMSLRKEGSLLHLDYVAFVSLGVVGFLVSLEGHFLSKQQLPCLLNGKNYWQKWGI